MCLPWLWEQLLLVHFLVSFIWFIRDLLLLRYSDGRALGHVVFNVWQNLTVCLRELCTLKKLENFRLVWCLCGKEKDEGSLKYLLEGDQELSPNTWQHWVLQVLLWRSGKVFKILWLFLTMQVCFWGEVITTGTVWLCLGAALSPAQFVSVGCAGRGTDPFPGTSKNFCVGFLQSWRDSVLGIFRDCVRAYSGCAPHV